VILPALSPCPAKDRASSPRTGIESTSAGAFMPYWPWPKRSFPAAEARKGDRRSVRVGPWQKARHLSDQVVGIISTYRAGISRKRTFSGHQDLALCRLVISSNLAHAMPCDPCQRLDISHRVKPRFAHSATTGDTRHSKPLGQSLQSSRVTCIAIVNTGGCVADLHRGQLRHRGGKTLTVPSIVTA